MINRAKGTYDVLPSESHKWTSLEEKARDFNAFLGIKRLEHLYLNTLRFFTESMKSLTWLPKKRMTFMTKVIGN